MFALIFLVFLVQNDVSTREFQIFCTALVNIHGYMETGATS